MNWKDIKDFKGIYKVNSLGEVRRAGATQNRKKQLTRKGYYKVFLYNKNNKRAYFVHRLVAQTFIPNPQNKPNINHKNCLKTDNRVNNLEWCTQSENQLHAYKTGLQKPSKSQLGKLGILNHRSKKVNQYDLKGNFIKTWDCARDIHKELNYSLACISRACNRKQEISYNFIWRFK